MHARMNAVCMASSSATHQYPLLPPYVSGCLHQARVLGGVQASQRDWLEGVEGVRFDIDGLNGL